MLSSIATVDPATAQDGGPCAQAIDWLGMSLAVPGDWEVVRHAVSVRKGHLAFVDRRHQRLTLYWTGCPSPPDAALLLEGSRAADGEQHPTARFSGMSEVGAWRGYRWRDEQGSVTRAAHFDEALGRWVEMVFSWPGPREQELEQAVLRSYRGEAAAAGHTRAFGLDVRAPQGWALTRADVLPADVTLSYRGAAGEASVCCTRMARQWCRGDLDSLVRLEPRGAAPEVRPARAAVHEARLARSRERGFAWRWLAGGRRVHSELVWLCPAADAVYRVQTRMHPRRGTPPEAFAVRCCDAAREAA